MQEDRNPAGNNNIRDTILWIIAPYQSPWNSACRIASNCIQRLLPSLHLFIIVGDTFQPTHLGDKTLTLGSRYVLFHLEGILRLISSLPNDGSLPRASHRSKLVDRERVPMEAGRMMGDFDAIGSASCRWGVL